MPRLETFDPDSVPVVFDQVVVYIPKPRVSIRRKTVNGKPEIEVRRTFGADYDRLVDRVEEALAATMVELASALFEVTADLIRRNYRATDEDLDAILVLNPDQFGEEVPEPWATVWEVANGLPPKSSAPGPTPAASSSASTPTA